MIILISFTDADIGINANGSVIKARVDDNISYLRCRLDCHALVACSPPVVLKDGRPILHHNFVLFAHQYAFLNDSGNYTCHSKYINKRSNKSTLITSDTVEVVVFGRQFKVLSSLS